MEADGGDLISSWERAEVIWFSEERIWREQRPGSTVEAEFDAMQSHLFVAESHRCTLLGASTIHNCAAVFIHAFIPSSVIVLIDPSNASFRVDLQYAADMIRKVLACSFDGNASVWSNDIIATIFVPDHFRYGALSC